MPSSYAHVMDICIDVTFPNGWERGLQNTVNFQWCVMHAFFALVWREQDAFGALYCWFVVGKSIWPAKKLSDEVLVRLCV